MTMKKYACEVSGWECDPATRAPDAAVNPDAHSRPTREPCDTAPPAEGERTLLKSIFRFYYDGFRSMTLGRTLWLIVAIKLFIMFAILRLFFFQPSLQGTDEEKAEQVKQELLRHSCPPLNNSNL